MIKVPSLTFVPSQPANLQEVLEAQIRRLIEIGVPKEVKVTKRKFLDDAMAMAAEFVYSLELASIGLNRVWFVHYGVHNRFLCEAGVVVYQVNPCGLYEGVTTPSGLRIVQGQFGPKYKNRKLADIRVGHHPLEQLGLTKEGLTAFLFWGDDLPLESGMNFPGEVIDACGCAPCLGFLWERVPALLHGCEDDDTPDSGWVSVSRGG